MRVGRVGIICPNQISLIICSYELDNILMFDLELKSLMYYSNLILLMNQVKLKLIDFLTCWVQTLFLCLIRDSVKLKHLTFIFKSNLTHSKSQQKKKKGLFICSRWDCYWLQDAKTLSSICFSYHIEEFKLEWVFVIDWLWFDIIC